VRDARLQVAFGGLHPERVRSLYAAHGPRGTLSRLLRGALDTTDRVRSAVRVDAATRRIELAASSITVSYRGDRGYPALLAELPDAPDLLFARGRLPSRPGVAVVGTRRCTAYGRRLAEQYGRAIAAAGWPLVSGLARGIDGAAHRGTVAGGGVGVAVLGSGIDVMYPREHRELADALVAGGGAVVSEAPPGTPPEAWRFPPRNRIISGLSAAVVIVEATVRGGALITAEAALRHGRQVFVVPGDVGRPSSEGCNLLIRDGAHPVMGPEDLIEALELVLGPRMRGEAVPVGESELDPPARAVLGAVGEGADDVDALVEATGLGIAAVVTAVGRLEVSGLLDRDGPTLVATGRRSQPTEGGR
jgi:DNA processing protein